MIQTSLSDKFGVPGCNDLASILAATLPMGTGKYVTTTDSCTCADHKYRKRVCKHMRALRDGKNASSEQPTAAEDCDHASFSANIARISPGTDG